MMHQVRPWQAEALTPSATLGLHRVSGFVRRTGVLAALDAGAAAALLVLVGAPLVGPMVAVVFLAGFVPYLGAILATTIVGLATLALVGPAAAIVVVVGLGVAALMEDRLLRGTSIGRGAGIRPLVVLVVIPAGGAMFGLLGLVTVLPVTIFVLAIYRTVIGVLDLPEEAGAARPPAGDDGAWRIPVWLDRLGQWSWRGLVAVGLLVLGVRVLVVLPIIVVPVVLAVVIAATLLPLMTRLRAAGVSRGAAAAVTTLGVTVGIAVIVIVTLAWISEPMQEVAGTAQAGAASIDAGWLASAEGELMAALTFDLGEILRSLFEVGLAAVLVVLLTFFFLMDGSRIWETFTEPVHGARRQHLDEAGERSVGILSGYMVGTALVSLFGAVTGAIIMWLLGLPLVIPIAVLTFFGGFIPYIGSFITTALAFLVAVAVGTTADVVIMAAYTLVFNLVQGSFVAPIVYGRALSLHPAIVLLAVPVGSAVAGILGMFLVVPVVAIVSATWRLVVATIEDDQPAPTDDADGSGDGDAPVVPARVPGPAVPDPT